MIDNLKLKYFYWHFSTSLLVAVAISLICQYYWFPSPFLLLDGTWFAILILVCVDVTLGPLLTFIIVSSKKAKNTLIIDMGIIIIFQICALVYGLMQIERERVVAIIHYGDAFHLVAKKEVAMDVLLSNSELSKYKGVFYAMVTRENQNQYLAPQETPPLYSPMLYQPLSEDAIKSRVFPYHNVPIRTKLEYGSKYIYKLLVGKKRTANIVFDQQMNIIDITLIPKANS